MARRKLPGLVLAAALLVLAGQGFASPLKADEELLLFPTAAAYDRTAGGWRVPVHAWVFEREKDSLWRRAVVHELLELLDLPADSVRDELFRARAWMFLVDNEGGKRFTLQTGGIDSRLGPTGDNGHLRTEILVPAPPPQGGGEGRLVLTVRAPDGRVFSGEVALLPPTGVSVVSDIDDTIKISGVGNKEELLANTFLRPFAAVPGMAAAYRCWAARGAVFCYLSASPWQLFPALRDFLHCADFPTGSLELRTFRLKDRSFFNLFTSPRAYKLPRLQRLLARFPERRFVLVGDSGEQDPEIYAELARTHPGQVAAIYIRDLTGSPATAARCAAVFRPLSGVRWQLFRDGADLPANGW